MSGLGLSSKNLLCLFDETRETSVNSPVELGYY